jgi:hypothetical protein
MNIKLPLVALMMGGCMQTIPPFVAPQTTPAPIVVQPIQEQPKELRQNLHPNPPNAPILSQEQKSQMRTQAGYLRQEMEQ